MGRTGYDPDAWATVLCMESKGNTNETLATSEADLIEDIRMHVGIDEADLISATFVVQNRNAAQS